MKVKIVPKTLAGRVSVPPSKSVAHRLLLCAGLAEGESRIGGIALSEDMQATITCLRALGADVTRTDDGVKVRGLPYFAAVNGKVDCRESGSTLRFFVPLFARVGAPVTLTGAPRLLQRPQQVYADIFHARGLQFRQTETEITVCGPLPAGEYTVPGNVSSQFITGLLTAQALAGGRSVVRVAPPFESSGYVALTIDAMRRFGVEVQQPDKYTFCINGNQKYKPCDCVAEGDYSQAAFWAVAGSVAGGVQIDGLNPQSLQGDKVIVDILRRCNAQITQTPDGLECRESVLRATEIDLADCPDLGPVLMVLALFCHGETVIRNAGRLRMKESDRIAAMQAELAKMGGAVLADENTVAVSGTVLHGADDLDSHNDHRVAMALAVAAVAAGVPVTIGTAQAVNKSYPQFYQHLRQLGAEVTLLDE